ncbi:tRNA(Glu)-specific nuclease WapA [bacterium HR15]|nr:tRNA(Glu)-specific nuclease WapA [bacterium HR15]
MVSKRGIEAVVAVNHAQGNQVSLRWLLYDGHGNLVRTMSPDYTLSGFQWRGVWGELQGVLGVGRGYCANLGHPEDETGLVSMRARYYEPATGRFLSEDPARDGVNWYLYADGNPVNQIDKSGLSTLLEFEFSTAEEAALSGQGNAVAQVLLGRAKDLVTALQNRYTFLRDVLRYGFDRAGNLGIKFKDSLGNEQLFRFVYQNGQWILKHNASGTNFGVGHHVIPDGELRILLNILETLL